jgi:hypothetical protein
MYSSWMRWTDGPDAANALFHAVNDCHLKKQPIVFTTNKSPLTAWGSVLHDHDLAEAIFDRILERGRLLVLDGPSYRMRHSPALDLPDSNDDHATKPDRISGKKRTKFPEAAKANGRGLPVIDRLQLAASQKLVVPVRVVKGIRDDDAGL